MGSEQLWRVIPPLAVSSAVLSAVSLRVHGAGPCWVLTLLVWAALGAPGGWRQQTENMQTISTSTIITCQPGAERATEEMGTLTFSIFSKSMAVISKTQ